MWAQVKICFVDIQTPPPLCIWVFDGLNSPGLISSGLPGKPTTIKTCQGNWFPEASWLYLAILCVFDLSRKSEKYVKFLAKKREKCEKNPKWFFTIVSCVQISQCSNYVYLYDFYQKGLVSYVFSWVKLVKKGTIQAFA